MSDQKDPSADFDVSKSGKRITAKGRFTIGSLVGVLTVLCTTVGAIWVDRNTIYAGIGENRTAIHSTTRDLENINHDVKELQDQSTVMMSRVNQDHDAITRMATQTEFMWRVWGGPVLDKGTK